MPPRHMKLVFRKQFVTALDEESLSFYNLQDFFPELTEAKVRADVFVIPKLKISGAKINKDPP